jgi:hypothetical protein
MASELILKKLFEASKLAKHVFQGLSDQDIWQACQSYQAKSDEIIEGTIRNVEKEEARLQAEENRKQDALEASHQKMKQIKLEEKKYEATDKEAAEGLLKQLTPVVRKSWWQKLWDYLTKKL